MMTDLILKALHLACRARVQRAHPIEEVASAQPSVAIVTRVGARLRTRARSAGVAIFDAMSAFDGGPAATSGGLALVLRAVEGIFAISSLFVAVLLVAGVRIAALAVVGSLVLAGGLVAPVLVAVAAAGFVAGEFGTARDLARV